MVVNVLVEISHKNIDKTFDYIVPSNLEEKIKIGKRVTVPFGHQTLEGFILGTNDTKLENLKEIIDVVDEDIVLTEELLDLGKYVSNTTLSTLISAYQVMLPKALKAQKGTKINKKIVKYIELECEELNIKLTEKQQNIYDIVKDKKRVKKEELNKISLSSTNTLIKKNIFKELEIEEYRLDEDFELEEKYPLTTDQQKVVDDILQDNENNTFLIHGVTGSGKTEVYMEIIEKMKEQNKTSIVLVPEISLTPQIVNRFRKRFGKTIAILHSRLSEGEKYDEYRKISRGEVDIVIGARSAVFAPLKNIGTIIIDEEHSQSYKQESHPKYSAIDVAIERSKYHNAKVILGSATPSLETYARAKKGVYKLLELKNRVNNRPLPKVDIIDMNKEKNKTSYFSKKLTEMIKDRLQKQEQIILLLNRRGYASFVTCSNCGYVEKCPNCDITLTFHKSSNTLRCHYCGYGNKRIDTCPECKEQAIKELGVGTEKVEEEINSLFNCRVIRMDFDTTSTKGAHEKIIEKFKNHEYDILLGTQMIAKGLDFENVTLVGVINSDTSLMIPNFRSSEYTFQLLSQVAGRSGRGKKEGNVIIQTHNPDHYAIEFSKTHDYINFYNHEMKIRKELSYSPYFYMTSIKIISKDYEKAKEESNKVGSFLKEKLNSSIILGPTVCSVFRMNNLYRFNIIIKYKKEENLYKALNYLQGHYKNINNVDIDIDFNPINI